MKKGAGGAIVNLSSIAGIRGSPDLFAYDASKGAVRALTKEVAVYCARQGYEIRCNSVHPAAVRTPMVRDFFAGRPDEGRMTLERLGGHAGHPARGRAGGNRRAHRLARLRRVELFHRRGVRDRRRRPPRARAAGRPSRRIGHAATPRPPLRHRNRRTEQWR